MARSPSQGSGALPAPPSPPSFSPSAEDWAQPVSGVASALLLDVRNVYPYGTASAVSGLSALSVTFGSDRRTDELRRAAALQGVENLVPEVTAMIGDLVVEIAKKAASIQLTVSGGSKRPTRQPVTYSGNSAHPRPGA